MSGLKLISVFVPLLCACAGQRSSAPARSAPPPSEAAPAPAAPGTEAADNVVEQELLPAEIDPAATQYGAPQYALTPARAPRAEHLVVYLVGAKSVPSNGRSMGRYLAGLGFPVVIPGYANDYDIRKLCEGKSADPDCHGKLRLEAFEGKDHSPHISVAPADSIEARITSLLVALDKRLPSADWGKFLAGNKPSWEQIIVAGHSHGASSAGLIGKHRKVHRVVMLSGPFDNHDGQPAAWTKRESATAADRFFALSHTQEDQHAGHLKDWAALGLGAFGPVTSIDVAAPPFAGSHQLTTAAPAPEGGNAHGGTAAGKSAPRMPDGSFRFDAAWRYLFGL